MNVNDYYKSNTDYLKAEDLEKNKEYQAVIVGFDEAQYDSGKKLVLLFQGWGKGLVLNKTNAMTIAEAYGHETQGWLQRGIFIYRTMTDYAGKQVDALRVRVPMQQAAAITNTAGAGPSLNEQTMNFQDPNPQDRQQGQPTPQQNLAQANPQPANQYQQAGPNNQQGFPEQASGAIPDFGPVEDIPY